MKLLLESGSDINVRNSNDKSSLDLAAQHGRHEVASFLAERMGVDLLETEFQSRDAADSSVEGRSGGGDDETSNDAKGMTLHTASGRGHLDIVRTRLDREADVDSRNDLFETLLDLASDEGRLEVVRLLIDRGADVNYRNKRCWTPLHEAAWQGLLDVAQLLLERGAEIDARNDDDEAPLDLASSQGHLGVVHLLIDRGVDRD